MLSSSFSKGFMTEQNFVFARLFSYGCNQYSVIHHKNNNNPSCMPFEKILKNYKPYIY